MTSMGWSRSVRACEAAESFHSADEGEGFREGAEEGLGEGELKLGRKEAIQERGLAAALVPAENQLGAKNWARFGRAKQRQHEPHGPLGSAAKDLSRDDPKTLVRLELDIIHLQDPQLVAVILKVVDQRLGQGLCPACRCVTALQQQRLQGTVDFEQISNNRVRFNGQLVPTQTGGRRERNEKNSKKKENEKDKQEKYSSFTSLVMPTKRSLCW